MRYAEFEEKDTTSPLTQPTTKATNWDIIETTLPTQKPHNTLEKAPPPQGSQLDFIKKNPKANRLQKLIRLVKQAVNVTRILANTHYCRHPLKIYKFIEKLATPSYNVNQYKPIIAAPTLAGQFFFITNTRMIRETMKYPRLANSDLVSEGRQLRIIAEALGRMRLSSGRQEAKDKRNVLAHLMAKPERYLPTMLTIADKLAHKWQKTDGKPIVITQDVLEFTVETFLKPIMNFQGPYAPIVSILEKQIDLLGRRLAYRHTPRFEQRFTDLRWQLMRCLAPTDNQSSTSEYAQRLSDYISKSHKDAAAEAFSVGLNGGILSGYLAPAPAFIAAIYELAKHPRWQDQLSAEIHNQQSKWSSLEEYITSESTLLHAIIHEVLRLNPSQPFLFRNIENDILMDNKYYLPKGSQIVCDIYHALRDPQEWGKDSEVFNPLRFSDNPAAYKQSFLAYSTGPNNCLGQYFSRQSLKVLLYSLCNKFRWSTPTPAAKHKFHFALTFDRDVIIKLHPLNTTAMEK